MSTGTPGQQWETHVSHLHELHVRESAFANIAFWRERCGELERQRDALAKRVEELEGAVHQRDKGIKDLCMLCRNKNMSNEDRREHAQRLALAAGFQPSITRAELEGEGGDD
ncbi:MAG: hypothetical protein HRT64_12640 [Erythrobacter sp.]|nr:hypothetical protein [Erythrobacter sp.]